MGKMKRMDIYKNNPDGRYYAHRGKTKTKTLVSWNFIAKCDAVDSCHLCV